MKKLLVASATVLLLALTGCGNSEPKEPESSVLTKAEFIKKADGICAASQARLEKSGADISENTSMAEIQAFLEKQAIPEVSATVVKLRELNPPKAEAAEVDALLTEIETEIVKVKKNPMAVMGDDAFASARKLAVAFGLKTCLQ